MTPTEFESIISANEILQTLALDRTATGIGTGVYTSQKTQFLSIKTTNDISGIDQESLWHPCLIKNALNSITCYSYKFTVRCTHSHHSFFLCLSRFKSGIFANIYFRISSVRLCCLSSEGHNIRNCNFWCNKSLNLGLSLDVKTQNWQYTLENKCSRLYLNGDGRKKKII